MLHDPQHRKPLILKKKNVRKRREAYTPRKESIQPLTSIFKLFVLKKLTHSLVFSFNSFQDQKDEHHPS